MLSKWEDEQSQVNEWRDGGCPRCCSNMVNKIRRRSLRKWFVGLIFISKREGGGRKCLDGCLEREVRLWEPRCKNSCVHDSAYVPCGFREARWWCRLHDRNSFCDASSITHKLKDPPNKGFLNCGPTLKYQGSRLSQRQVSRVGLWGSWHQGCI